jgi:two-component system sensor kinase FixL
MLPFVTDERPETDPSRILDRLDQLQRELNGVRTDSDQAERLGVLGTLASMIAHEVRGIASKVAGTAQLIERHADDPARVRDLAARVTRLGLHAGRVAEAILAAADEPLPGDCSVLEIHRRALDALPSEARTRMDDSSINPRLRAGIDPDALERVLVNLYLNAWRAVGGTGGSGCIRVAASRRQCVGTDPCSMWNMLEIRVGDDGPGIHPELVDAVFEPWQRGGSTSPGHGLGLALCRHLVGSVGGTIRFDTPTPPAGTGAEVVIELPEHNELTQAA